MSLEILLKTGEPDLDLQTSYASQNSFFPRITLYFEGFDVTDVTEIFYEGQVIPIISSFYSNNSVISNNPLVRFTGTRILISDSFNSILNIPFQSNDDFLEYEQFFTIKTESSTSSPYTKLDLYEDESIELTQRIKEYKDISKVFADFTKSFKIPCSKVNNRSFGNFYNNEITDAFDARFKTECIITIDGVKFKDGFISLLGVSMMDGQPSSYNISFTSANASLKTILGDTKVSDLTYLDVFNHPLIFTDIKDKFLGGSYLTYDEGQNPLTLENFGNLDHSETSPVGTTQGKPTQAGDLIYPFISSESRYFYSSTQSSVSTSTTNRQLRNNGALNYNRGVNTYDLAPSIRVLHIIKAIEKQFNIKFSDDSVFSSYLLSRRSYLTNDSVSSTLIDYLQGKSDFINSLYIHCNKKAGSSKEQTLSGSKSVSFSDFTLASSQDVRDSSGQVVLKSSTLGIKNRDEIDFSFRVFSSDNNGKYVVSIKEDGQEVYNSGTVSGNKDFKYTSTVGYRYGLFDKGKTKTTNITIELSSPSFISNLTLSEIEVSLFKTFDPVFSGDYRSLVYTSLYTYSTPIQLNDYIDFRRDNAPTIKCIDFLKELFKLLNLVAYVDGDVIRVYHYNDYMGIGKFSTSYNLIDDSQRSKTVDISKYIDSKSYSIDRSEVFSEVNFEFNDIKTINGVKYKDLTGDNFGNENYKSDIEKSFDGGKYEVKLKFDKMLYEQLYDANPSERTDIRLAWGYSVSDSSSPISVPNLLHFVKTGKMYDSSPFPTSIFPVTNGQNEYFKPNTSDTALVWSPRNFLEEDASSLSQTINLNFGDEAYNDESINENSLFKNYYQDQILQIFSNRSRLIKIDAYMPVSVFKNIKLNDKIIINGKEHIINSMKTNLNSDKTKFELITL